jgi:hypothetical protein
MKIFHLGLLLILMCGSLIAMAACSHEGGLKGLASPRGDVNKENQAKRGPAESWIGTTSQGETISFKIESNAITSLTLNWSLPLTEPCSDPVHPGIAMTKRGGIDTWYFPPGSQNSPIPIIDQKFGLSQDSGDVRVKITGAFDPDRSASGTLEFKTTPTSSCKGNAVATWKATRTTLGQEPLKGSIPVAKPSQNCSFKCDIDKEGYKFGVTCEAGRVDTMMEDRTEFEYGPQGQRKVIKLSVNQKLTYVDSKNTYRIRGSIHIDTMTNTVQYNISAVGGVFGDTPQRCKSSDTTLPSLDAPVSSTPVSKPGQALSLKAPPTLTTSIVVPACQRAYEGGKISGNTYLCMMSEKGDFIGEGKTWIHLPGSSTISVELSGVDGNRVKAKVGEGGDSWDLSFVTARGQGWAAGMYENAERDPFQGPSNPGIDVSGHSRGCNKISGRFEILELVSEGTPREIKRFAANFLQHCDGRAPLSGYLRFNSTVKP